MIWKGFKGAHREGSGEGTAPVLARAGANLLLAALLLTLPLTGCTSTKRQRSEKITLEFWTLQLDTFKDTLQPMFTAYEKTHPNIHIHWVDVPFSEGPKRTLTAIMSEHVPDVVNLNPDFSAVLASRHALVNMRDALPAAIQAQYLPVAWQAATLQLSSPDAKLKISQDEANPAIIKSPETSSEALSQPKNPAGSMTFGLPWYITSSVTLYNKAILQKAGLSQPPSTFAELPHFAETVKNKTGAYGLMPIIAESGNFLKELKKMGVTLYDAQGRAAFAVPKAVDLLQDYVTMYRQGWVPAEAITESHQAAVGRYQAGTLATFMIGPNFLKIVKENAPDIYKVTGVAPQFPKDATFKDFSMMVVVVPRKSAHVKEATEFAAYITNAQNQLALAQAAPVLPSVSAALKSPYFKAAPSDDLMAMGRNVSARQLLEATEAYTIQPNQNANNEIINHYVQLAMLGKVTPTAAIQQAQQEINEIMEP